MSEDAEGLIFGLNRILMFMCIVGVVGFSIMIAHLLVNDTYNTKGLLPKMEIPSVSVVGDVNVNYVEEGTINDVHDNTINITNNEAAKVSYVIPATVLVVAMFIIVITKMCLSYCRERNRIEDIAYLNSLRNDD